MRHSKVFSSDAVFFYFILDSVDAVGGDCNAIYWLPKETKFCMGHFQAPLNTDNLPV